MDKFLEKKNEPEKPLSLDDQKAIVLSVISSFIMFMLNLVKTRQVVSSLFISTVMFVAALSLHRVLDYIIPEDIDRKVDREWRRIPFRVMTYLRAPFTLKL